MVNNLRNVSAYPKPVPANAGADGVDRIILGGPLYTPEQVLELVNSGGNKLEPWTKKCVRDMRYKLGIDHEGAAALVRQAVREGRFCKAEWCQGNVDGLWAACDVYVLKRAEWIQAAYKELEIEYYIKFAINKSGKLLLLISCHNSEFRG